MEEAIVTVVNNVWGKYDKDGSGSLDKEEAMRFVQDSLGQMTGDHKFTPADYEQFFKDLDKDGSGDVDKEEMFRFVRQVCGCPSKEDLAAAAKQTKPKRGELSTKQKEDRAAKAAEEAKAAQGAQKTEMDAICPLSKEMANLS